MYQKHTYIREPSESSQGSEATNEAEDDQKRKEFACDERHCWGTKTVVTCERKYLGISCYTSIKSKKRSVVERKISLSSCQHACVLLAMARITEQSQQLSSNSQHHVVQHAQGSVFYEIRH